MKWTSWKTALIDISVDDDLTAEVDLGYICDSLLMYIPTIDLAQVSIEVSEKSGGTFADLYVTDPADGGNNQVISASGTGDFHWVVPLGGFQFIKVKTSASQTAGDVSIRVRGVIH
jgi:hypothetical protein